MWSRAMFSSNGNNLLVFAGGELYIYQAPSLSEIQAAEARESR
jgi:hypothetical protein